MVLVSLFQSYDFGTQDHPAPLFGLRRLQREPIQRGSRLAKSFCVRPTKIASRGAGQ